MKKLLTGIMALSLAASMAVPAFAANNATNDGTDGTNIAVNGTYQAGAPADDVISVDLAWDDMSFTYTEGEKGDWFPGWHEYYNGTDGTWAWTHATEDPYDPAPIITVTNHSNTAVTASFAFTGSVEGLSGNFTNNKTFLDTAENTEPDNAPTIENDFWVDGTGIDADKDIGTITVTVAKYVVPATQTISTAEDLLATATKDGVFELQNDIDLGSAQLEIKSPYYVLDLNGHTLSGSYAAWPMIFVSNNSGKVTVKNGTVQNTSSTGNGIVTNNNNFRLEKCKVVAAHVALDVRGTAYIADCEIENADTGYISFIASSNLTLSGNVTVGSFAPPLKGTLTVLPGTYNFDVTEYVDTNLYTVTENTEAGTWTVAAK